MTDQENIDPLPSPDEPTIPWTDPAHPPRSLPDDPWVRPQRVQRPLLGASLWCFGALFWAYLVVGEIMVWTALPEIMGVLAVLGAYGLAWYHATSQLPQAPRWRWLLPGIIAFFVWLIVLLVSTAVFSTGGRKEAELAALLLWSCAGASYALGRHLTAQQRVPLTPNARAGRVALWLIAGIATLLAGVNIIGNA
ncbi:MAG TPA: hypothetical protein VHM25_07440 [Polyangiaceae bacterium]|jgi:hypothetical protein|nr:hypothetical protein [Polyangiaceae bacterium]